MLLLMLPKATLGLLAGLGIPKFQYELARAYYTARFGEQNPSKAATWCRRAAERGWPPAECLLATFYVAGLEAAQQGLPEAQYAVADCLFSGTGTPTDLEMADQWCRLAIKNGAESAAELLSRIEAAA